MQEVKQYLNQLKYIDQDIQSRQEELDRIRRSLTSVSATTYKQDTVQETHKPNYDDRYVKLIELDEHISQRIDDLSDLKYTISKQIDKCEDRLHSIILRERYINLKKWDEIADGLNSEVRNITRIHGQALKEFYQNNKSDILKFRA